ncbi:DUF11 domain-containing protein [Methanobrevibacter sp.]|uniref:DUF11 domain-containing protein n=1 Tax=Methanobrevibacter sp. TaxID=66852 RepID=UPI00388E50C7
MIPLIGLTCVSAHDLNGTDMSMDDRDSSDLKAVDESTFLTTDESDSLGSAGENLSAAQTSSQTESKSYLILDNDADIENIYIGDHVTWIVSVINKGPDTAKNVRVYDELPDGLIYVSHTTTKGSFNPETGIWYIGGLSVDDGEVFLYITTKAISVGEKINKATLTSDTRNLNENESFEEEEIDVFDHAVKAHTEKSIATLKATGNPIALILLSLFAIFITYKSKL